MDQMKIDSPWKLTTVQGSGPFPTQEIDVSGIKRKWLDVAYADQSPAQKLDIFLPDEGEGPFPVYIFMHGGAYLFGAKRDAQLFHAIDGVTKGYAVVTVEQRLAGDSAGAYYAIMCAATQDIPGFEDETMGNAGVSSKVQAVIGFYGCYDLMKMLPPEMPEPPKGAAPGPGAGGPPMPDLYQALVGAKPRAIHGLMYFTNPFNFITDKFPPILIQAGTKDQIVPPSQSQMLYDKVVEKCGEGRAELEFFEGWNHGGFSTDWYEPKHQGHIYQFLDRLFK